MTPCGRLSARELTEDFTTAPELVDPQIKELLVEFNRVTKHRIHLPPGLKRKYASNLKNSFLGAR